MSHGFIDPRTDPLVHKRFLEYREKHEYFGHAETRQLSLEEFAPLDTEYRALDAIREEDRDDEETARYEEVARVLFRD